MKKKYKLLAEESSRTKKTRERLKKHFDELEQNITPQALKRKAIEIHRWIERHSHERIPLKSKKIALFDENKNTAGVSHKVSKLVNSLKS